MQEKSKEFELRGGGRSRLLLPSLQVDGLAELLVGDLEDGDETFIGDEGANTPDVDGRGFEGGAMPDVHGELEHGKAVFQEVFPEAGCRLALCRSLHWKVEHDVEPHDGIGIEGVVGWGHGRNDGRRRSGDFSR